MPRLGGQVLLVAGSAVGAGLLALPAVTYASGFVPSCATLVAVWAYMGATALLLVEAAARDHRPRPNLLGMAQANLGTSGRVICFALYVLIYAATITAYISEGGRQAVTILKVVLECLGTDFTMHCSSYPVPPGWISRGQTLFATFFGFAVYCGPGAVERLNSLCMCGAVLAFGLLVRASTAGTAAGDLDRANWGELDHAIPVIVVAFSYHNIVPSVFCSLENNTALASKAVLLGSALPLALYVVWQAVVLGSMPDHGYAPSASEIFDQLRDSAGLALPIFSLLAVVTSLLGVGLGCVDFAEDAFSGGGSGSPDRKGDGSEGDAAAAAAGEIDEGQGSGGGGGRGNAVMVTFGPCLGFALYFPGAFLPALEFSGIFRQVLFGAVPVLMVWRGRQAAAELAKAAPAASGRGWKDQPALRRAKSYSGGLISSQEVLPFGGIGLGFVAAMTALLLMLELSHMLSAGH